MNHLELLKKYMDVVLDREGVTFVLYIRDDDERFSEAELQELRRIHEEVCND